jgi:hypothetical protein
MINYLPADQRKQLRAARSNVLLLRYNIGLIFAAVFMGLAILTIFFLLTNEKQNAEGTIATNQARVGNFSSVQAQADSFRKDLVDAKSLFDSEIDYSKIYLEVSRLIPSGAVLDSLKLDAAQIGQPMTLSMKIKGEQQATSLLAAFKSSAMFGNAATYESLSANAGTDSGTYPYIIAINVTINKSEVK